MKIDVIIPIYKPDEGLFTLLDRLLEQSVPIHRIILMNTGREYFDALIKENEYTTWINGISTMGERGERLWAIRTPRHS